MALLSRAPASVDSFRGIFENFRRRSRFGGVGNSGGFPLDGRPSAPARELEEPFPVCTDL